MTWIQTVSTLLQGHLWNICRKIKMLLSTRALILKGNPKYFSKLVTHTIPSPNKAKEKYYLPSHLSCHSYFTLTSESSVTDPSFTLSTSILSTESNSCINCTCDTIKLNEMFVGKNDLRFWPNYSPPFLVALITNLYRSIDRSILTGFNHENNGNFTIWDCWAKQSFCLIVSLWLYVSVVQSILRQTHWFHIKGYPQGILKSF